MDVAFVIAHQNLHELATAATAIAFATSESARRHLAMIDQRPSPQSPSALNGTAKAFSAVDGGSMRQVTPAPPNMFSSATAFLVMAPSTKTAAQQPQACAPIASVNTPSGDKEYSYEMTNDDTVETMHDGKDICSSNDAMEKAHALSYQSSLVFPVVVHRMIGEISSLDPTIMHWSDDGSLFWICLNDKEGQREILKRYFKRTFGDNLILPVTSLTPFLTRLSMYRWQLPVASSTATYLPIQKDCVWVVRIECLRMLSLFCCVVRELICSSLALLRGKGYWHHTNFSRQSSYNTLLTSCKLKRREGYKRRSRRKKVVGTSLRATDNDLLTDNSPGGFGEAPFSEVIELRIKTKDNTSTNKQKKGSVLADLNKVPVKIGAAKTSVMRKAPLIKSEGWPKKKPRVTTRTSNVQLKTPAVSFEEEFNRDISPMIADCVDLGLVAEWDSLADYVVPAPQQHQLFSCDEVIVGTAALATLAAAASLVHPSSFSPVVLASEQLIIRESAAKNSKLETSSPAAIKMILSADRAPCLFPSPPKIVDYPFIGQALAHMATAHDVHAASPKGSSHCDDAMTDAFLMGWLNSPLKTSGEKSAFAPVSLSDMTNRSSPDFYGPFVGMAGTLYEVVGINADASSDEVADVKVD